MIEKFREPMNALTHLIGAILSVIGTIGMIIQIATKGEWTPLYILSVLAFGTGLVALYTASFVYHAVHGSEQKLMRLKKIDHSMIFVLIAGSYTPFCLLALSGKIGMMLLTAIWITAVIGVVLMIFWIKMPRWLNTALYILMGWMAVFAVKPLYSALPLSGFCFLVSGGVMYTIGGAMYGLKKPNLSPIFGFHEVFHIFVMLGSLCHYYTVFRYLLWV